MQMERVSEGGSLWRAKRAEGRNEAVGGLARQSSGHSIAIDVARNLASSPRSLCYVGLLQRHLVRRRRAQRQQRLPAPVRGRPHRARVSVRLHRRVDELMVALGCRFAVDVFTIAQQDRPLADPDPLPRDPGHALWR